MRNTINRHNAYKIPSPLTAMTQLFSLQLPSDLVSIWIHTTIIYKVLDVSLVTALNVQAAYNAKFYLLDCLNPPNSHEATRELNSPECWNSAPNSQPKTSSLLQLCCRKGLSGSSGNYCKMRQAGCGDDSRETCTSIRDKYSSIASPFR